MTWLVSLAIEVIFEPSSTKDLFLEEKDMFFPFLTFIPCFQGIPRVWHVQVLLQHLTVLIITLMEGPEKSQVKVETVLHTERLWVRLEYTWFFSVSDLTFPGLKSGLLKTTNWVSISSWLNSGTLHLSWQFHWRFYLWLFSSLTSDPNGSRSGYSVNTGRTSIPSLKDLPSCSR